MSQYEFRRDIAITWLQEGTITLNQKKRPASDISSMSSSDSSGKARRINDAALDPQNGSLRRRLDDDMHYPVKADAKRPCCSLCRWAEQDRDHKMRSNIVSCDKCGVSLCINCFKPFHTISTVSKLRSEVKKNNSKKE